MATDRQKIQDAKTAARDLNLEALQRTARVSRNRAKYTRKAKHRAKGSEESADT